MHWRGLDWPIDINCQEANLRETQPMKVMISNRLLLFAPYLAIMALSDSSPITYVFRIVLAEMGVLAKMGHDSGCLGVAIGP